MSTQLVGAAPPGLRLEFTLPWPPTTNNLFRNGAFAGRKLTREAKSYVARVGELALIDPKRMPRFVLAGALGAILIAHPPDRRPRDLDNLLKAPFDALKKCGVLRDDADLDDVRIARASVIPGGRLEVTLWQL